MNAEEFAKLEKSAKEKMQARNRAEAWKNGWGKYHRDDTN